MKASSSHSKPSLELAPRADAIALLEADHESARELLEMLRRMTTGSLGRRRVVLVLTEDLWIHLQIEEEIFYPALARGGPSLSDGHHIRQAVKEGLRALEACPEEGFAVAHMAKHVLALNEIESAHEENHVFPLARTVLTRGELIALGDRLRARRQELRQSGVVRRDVGSPPGPPGPLAIS